MDRIVSVSTMAFDGYSLEVALDELAALGVRHVEPASVDKIFQHLVEEDFCDRRATWLRNELVARRLACLSLSVHMDLTGRTPSTASIGALSLPATSGRAA